MPKYRLRTPHGTYNLTTPRELSEQEVAHLTSGAVASQPDLDTALRGMLAGEAQEAKQAIAAGDVGRYLVPRMLPAAGALAGTLTGGPVGAALGAGPKTVTAITSLLEAIGGGGGEQLSQALGLAPSSPGAVVASAGLPLAGRAAGAAAQGLAQRGPWAVPGRQTMVAERARGLGTRVLKPESAEDVRALYAQAERGAGGLREPARVDLGDPATWQATPPAFQDPPTLADAFRGYQALGPATRAPGAAGGEAKRTYAAMTREFEDAITEQRPGWEAIWDFLKAQSEFKRLRTATELDEILEKAIRPTGAVTERANIKGLRAQFRTPTGRKAFTEKMTEQVEPGAWAGIEQELQQLQAMEPSAPIRALYGWGGRIAGPLIGGAAGGATYGAPGALTGSLLGIGAEQVLERLGASRLGLNLTKRAWQSPLLAHPRLAQTFSLGGQALRPFAEEQAP